MGLEGQAVLRYPSAIVQNLSEQAGIAKISGQSCEHEKGFACSSADLARPWFFPFGLNGFRARSLCYSCTVRLIRRLARLHCPFTFRR